MQVLYDISKTEILSSLVTGIISGLIASLMFTIFLFLIKPKVKVAPKIIRLRREDGTYTLKVKVVNHTKAMLTNVKYALYYCDMHQDKISNFIEIPPRKSPMMFIDKHDRKDEEAQYAVRLSYDIDEGKYPLSKTQRLQFVIMADHSFSNTTTCVKKEYYDKDIVDNGVYQFGDSMLIIKYNH